LKFSAEESMRLFYVAITRAKKKLYITTARKSKSSFGKDIENISPDNQKSTFYLKVSCLFLESKHFISLLEITQIYKIRHWFIS
jgi:superfamily I DNA/RNA helicase